MIVPPDRVATIAYVAGFRGDDLITAVAVSFGENGSHDSAALGDQSLAGQRTKDGRTWGPSVGLWQIRSIREERGTGGTRDELALRDPIKNGRSAFTLYTNRGGKFTDWTVYNEGIYKRHLAAAGRALDTAVAAGAIPNPGGGGGGGGGSWGEGKSWGERAVDVLEGAPIIGDAIEAGQAAKGGLEAIGGFFSLLTSWDTWRKVLLVIAGFALIVAALVIVVMDTRTTTPGEDL